MTKPRLVDYESVERDYGFDGVNAIVEHPEHGLLLVCDGYGEEDIAGGAVRWRHGLVAKLQPGDTLDGLHDETNDQGVEALELVVKGYDDKRPVLQWPAVAIVSLAKALDL